MSDEASFIFFQAKEVFDSHQYEEGIIENGGKIIILMELIKESLAQGDKMLIFRFVIIKLEIREKNVISSLEKVLN